MGRSFYKLLFAPPEINPVNRKAKSVPILNPFDPYGRVFFFSWLGFMVAFMSWYAFPPLVSSSPHIQDIREQVDIDGYCAVDGDD